MLPKTTNSIQTLCSRERIILNLGSLYVLQNNYQVEHKIYGKYITNTIM